jgi:hypothetical protein
MRLRLFCLFIAIFLNINALCDEKTRIMEENQYLEAELGLAKAPSLYFIFDFKEKSVYLKAKGTIFREWEIRRIRFWGNPLPVKSFSLIKKSALFPPKRKSIKPGKSEEKDNFELEVLELKDMPSSYTLSIEGDIVVYVRPKTKSFVSLLRNIGHSLRWYTFPPLKTLWFSLKKKRSYTAIDILLADEKDAKALYWAFLDGLKGIIYRPRSN